MMVLSAQRPDASLAEFLAYRARLAPISRLLAEVAGALLVLAAALWWKPPARMLIVSAVTCFGCYAAWGLLDRARTGASFRGWIIVARAFQASTIALTTIGLVAGACALYSIWALALGTWIS